ncbi:MAG TPA: hypothetical protein VIV11_41530 [Kofleriaceae bacterium]
MRLLAIATVATLVVAIVVRHIPPPRPVRASLGRGPGPICALLPRSCVGTTCAELIEMPLVGPGFIDVRIESENTSDTSTSYLRRDVMTLIQYAAAKVACKAKDWPTGNGGPIIFGDMSERDGSTPGTRAGSPRHPEGTHVAGRDIDIAYFQRDTLDNQLRPICRHHERRVDAYRCIAPPTRLDAWRTALLIGALLEDARVRVIGIDGLAATPLLAAFDELCETGWIDDAACSRRSRIVFETSNTVRGWFRGHHNHLHVSWWRY